jgi:uncharacterized protein (TIGR02594 family)
MIRALLTCVLLLAPNVAWAKHHHTHHEHNHKHQHHGVSHHRYPVAASDLRETGHPLVDKAVAYLGSRNPTGFRGPWCGAFMTMIAKATGHAVPGGPYRARSWASLPRTSPHVGAIAVFRHHVALVAGFRNGTPLLLGGNQGHRVSIHPMRRQAIAFVE